MEDPFTPERIDYILNATLRELTREGGETALLERLALEVSTTNWTKEDKEKVFTVAQLVISKYHEDDKRDDNTYATHILRVACRILSSQHFAIRDNPDLIIAALLHDTVEDRPERLLDEPELDENDMSPANLAMRNSQRQRAFDAIADTHGDDVATMVQEVTNPIYDKTDLSTEERQDVYRTHITDLMTSDSLSRYIKLSDFVDNCLGLEYNPDAKSRFKLATKYKPLLPDMLCYVLGSDIHQAMKDKISTELFFAHEVCDRIIKSKGLVQSLGSAVLPKPPTEHGAEHFFGTRDNHSIRH